MKPGRMKWMGAATVAAGIAVFLAAGLATSPASAQEGPGNEAGVEQPRSREERRAAREERRNQRIDRALESGRITAERADRLRNREPGAALHHAIQRHKAVHSMIAAAHRTLASAAEVVGLTPAELRERLAGGETLLDVAASAGIGEEDLKSRLVSLLNQRLDLAVADGHLTPEQAEKLRGRVDKLVDRVAAAEFPRRSAGLPRFQDPPAAE